MIEFKNLVKAQITQGLLTTLLERGGYRVTRLGIEELFGEVKYLDLKEYLGLRLPFQLRFLPDLLVAEIDLKQVFLVEVKFRKRFDARSVRSLYRELSKQREFWPDSYAVIMVAESCIKDGRFHQDYIRVLRPTETDRLINEELSFEQRWNHLTHLQQVFKNFKGSLEHQGNADLITTTLKDLAKL